MGSKGHDAAEEPANQFSPQANENCRRGLFFERRLQISIFFA